MQKIPITLNSIVADVLNSWPVTVPVFLERRLGCVGCAMAPFDTLADVVEAYQLEPGAFLGELESAIQAGTEAGDQAR